MDLAPAGVPLVFSIECAQMVNFSHNLGGKLMKSSVHACFLFAIAVLSGAAVGCGGGNEVLEARPEIAAAVAAPEETLGSYVKSQIYEFRAKVRKRGAASVKTDLPILLENLGSVDERSDSHAETYKEILAKLKAMSDSANRDALVKAVNEIGALADKLPGSANENPIVD